jgi:hypothetical protein
MAEQSAAPASNTPAPAVNTPAPAQQQPAQQQQTSAPRPAVDRTEARRQAISNDPAFYGGKDVAKTKALRDEMAAITRGEKYTPTPADKREPTTAERFKKAGDERAAAAKKAETEHVATLPDFEKRRLEITRALTDKNSKLSDQDRAALTIELRRIVAGQQTPEEHEAILNAPVTELREMFAIDHERVQPHLRERWDEEGEAEVLASFAHAGVSREGAQAVMGWYMDKFNQHLGDIDNVDFAAMEADFRQVARRAGLSERHINALIANERERLEG